VTLVMWDRRNVGRTLRRNGVDPSADFRRLMADGIELAEHLRRQFNVPAIGLLGHSVGSVVGGMMARERPDLLFSYVGTDQIANMRANEVESLRLLRERVSQRPVGSRVRRAVEALPALPYDDVDVWLDKQRLISLTDPLMPSYEQELLKSIIVAPDYSPLDLAALGRGLKAAPATLMHEMMTLDLVAQGLDFALQMLLFEGQQDVLDPSALALDFFDRLRAPVKHVTTVSNAGHNAMFQQPAAFGRFLRKHVVPLSKPPR
jgi:pimeloyl-ACP methyl ester carboxylesterase